MKIKTKRLILRQVKMKDCKSIADNLNNLNVTKWLLVVPYPYKLKDARWWVSNSAKKAKKKSDFNFGIELQSEKNIIGGIGIHHIDSFSGTAEVGYWLGERYWRQGYGSEALKAILNLAFKKLKLRRIQAGVFEGNPSSGKLLEKFGFKREGMRIKVHRCKADKKLKNEIMYGLLKSEYKK